MSAHIQSLLCGGYVLYLFDIFKAHLCRPLGSTPTTSLPTSSERIQLIPTSGLWSHRSPSNLYRQMLSVSLTSTPFNLLLTMVSFTVKLEMMQPPSPLLLWQCIVGYLDNPDGFVQHQLVQGIDYGHVIYILHYCIPKHMMLYIQQSGWLSQRGGTPSVSHLLYSDPPTCRHSFNVNLGGFNAIVDLVIKAQCQRLSISGFLNSTPSNCHMSGPCQLCDFCAHHRVCCFPCHGVSLISFFIGTPSCCAPSAFPFRALDSKHWTFESSTSQVVLSKLHWLHSS